MYDIAATLLDNVNLQSKTLVVYANIYEVKFIYISVPFGYGDT